MHGQWRGLEPVMATTLLETPVMSTRPVLLVPLLVLVLLGCNQAPPAPTGPTPETARTNLTQKEIDDDAKRGFDGLGEQMKRAERELEERAVSFLIKGVSDEQHKSVLFSKVQRLMDVQAKSNSVSSGGSYADGGSYFRISPISDIDVAAARIDFGNVLAVDPVARVIVVDALAPSAPRPEKGWPGAEAVEQFIIRAVVARFAREGADLAKTHGRDRVVVICMPNAASAALVKKLEPLAPISTSHGYPGTFGPQQTDYVLSTMAPVARFGDVVKALEGTPNLAVDEEKRIIIVDVPALKPRPASAKDQRATPPR